MDELETYRDFHDCWMLLLFWLTLICLKALKSGSLYIRIYSSAPIMRSSIHLVTYKQTWRREDAVLSSSTRFKILLFVFSIDFISLQVYYRVDRSKPEGNPLLLHALLHINIGRHVPPTWIFTSFHVNVTCILIIKRRFTAGFIWWPMRYWKKFCWNKIVSNMAQVTRASGSGPK